MVHAGTRTQTPVLDGGGVILNTPKNDQLQPKYVPQTKECFFQHFTKASFSPTHTTIRTPMSGFFLEGSRGFDREVWGRSRRLLLINFLLSN